MKIVEINNEVIGLIGDPHLGKQFINGVPLDRRGQKEEYQMATFGNELFAPAYHPQMSTVIVIGDLFDQFRVSNNVLLDTYEALSDAAIKFHKVNFIILMGNHDITRNSQLISSFDILELTFRSYKNVIFIKQNTWYKTLEGNVFLFCPYSAFDNSVEAFNKTKEYYQRDRGLVTEPLELAAVFGHWDIESFGGSDHNLVPYKELARVTKRIYTGHVHLPETFMIDSDGNRSKSATHCEVTVVGSMLPFSHGEDPTGEYYVTKTLTEYYEEIEKDHLAFNTKSLRILLKPGEEMPEDVKAAQITYKYVDKEEKEEVEVNVASFSFETIFKETMTENNVTDELSEKTWTRYKELNADATDA